MQALQHRWKHDPLAHVPEASPVKAVDFVKGKLHEVLEDRPPVPKGRSWLDKMLAGMTQAEKDAILAMTVKL